MTKATLFEKWNNTFPSAHKPNILISANFVLMNFCELVLKNKRNWHIHSLSPHVLSKLFPFYSVLPFRPLESDNLHFYLSFVATISLH